MRLSQLHNIPSLKELLTQRDGAIAQLQEFELKINEQEAEKQGHYELKGQTPYSFEPGANKAREKLYEINSLIKDYYPEHNL